MPIIPSGIIANTPRYFFRAMVPSYINKAMSANAMINAARGLGVSYRRTNMLRDIREFTGLMRKEGAVRATPADDYVKLGNMTEIDLKRDRRYRGFADVTYKNTLTGETLTKTISFYDDERRTAEDWAKEFDRKRKEIQYRDDEDLISFTLRAVEHQAGWDY